MVLACALAATSCSSSDTNTVDSNADGAAPTSEATTTEATTSTTAASSGDVTELCALFAADDLEDPAQLIEATPEEYREDMSTLVGIIEAMGADDDIDVSALAAALDDNLDMTDGLEALVANELQACDADDIAEFSQSIAMFRWYEGEPSIDYCAALTGAFATDLEDATDFAELGSIAPAEHDELIASLAALEDPEALSGMTEEAVAELGMNLAGLGLYTEARCDAPGAFTSALFAGVFLSLAANPDGLGADFGDAGDAGDPGLAEVARTPIDGAEAADILALVPDGRVTELEVVTLDLESVDHPGEYLVDIVMPAGWSVDAGFSVVLSPGNDFGFFTGVTLSASCQGLCAPTDDYESRFRELFDAETTVSEEALVAPTGLLVVLDGSFTRDIRAGLWNPAADRFFSCVASLDEGDETYEDFFAVICSSATPRWIEP